MDNDVIVSLSFSSYSTNGLASIAVKITKEFNHDAEDRTFNSLDEDDDFEFSLVLDDQGQIHHDDFLNRSKIGAKEMRDDFSVKVPLSKLFAYDHEEYSSNSSTYSSEAAEELEPEIPESTYCLWRPKFVESSNRWKKQSNSSTTERRCHKSKIWNKLCHLLLCRNNSHSKGPFVFLNSKHVAVNGTENVPGPSPVNQVLETRGLPWLRLWRYFMRGIKQRRKESRENHIFPTDNSLWGFSQRLW